MPFLVPWRCLVPLDAIGLVFGGDGSDGGFSAASGAEVKVSREDEAPATLSDKIVTVSGLVSQKEEACRLMIAKLWKAQGIAPDEEGIFVLVMPTCAVGAIIGTKGAKIKEIMDSSRADINVGREAIIGMPDNPMVLNGTQEQVLSATVLTNAVLQELAERDRVKEDDFIFIPGRQNAAPRPIPRGGLSGLSARFVVSKGAAGYLIGKGGQKVKEMKDESGANMQFRNAEEEPGVCLAEDDRVLEIRGGAQERDQGVRVVLAAMDQMPDPPRESRLLVPTTLDRSLVESAAASASVELKLGVDTRLGSPEPGEVIAELDGPMFARSKAILGILALVDSQAGGSAPSRPPSRPDTRSPQFGSVNSSSLTLHAADPAVPDSLKEETPSVDDIPAPLSRAGGVADEAQEEEERIEPETGKAFTWSEFQVEFSKTYTADEVRDYWRDACKPVPKSERKTKVQEALPTRPSLEDHQVRASSHAVPSETLQDPPRQQQQPLQLPTPQPQQLQQSSDVQRMDALRQPSEIVGRPEDVLYKAAESKSHELPAPSRQDVVQHPVEQRLQDKAEPSPAEFGRHADVSSSVELGRPTDAFNFTPMQDSAFSSGQQQLFGSRDASAMWGSGFDSPYASNNFAGIPGFAQFGVPHTQLQLLLPKAIVQGKLAQNGQLAVIAEACRVQIDLDAAASIPQEKLRVILSGSVVGNSLAALMLQGHILLADG
mmetsp:Transcript_10380/g.16546  ORF Transcript_10380/g.16546 Transcript_10380/m.16546 type:complete len:715 (-) Transcript_10380:26-2170(-)